MFIIFLPCEIIFNLSLCCKFRLHVIMTKAVVIKKSIFYMIDLVTEHIFQYLLIDILTTISLMIKPDSSFIKFTDINRNSRFKMSHNAFNRMIRNTPNAEEAENMIYSESIKIITHFFKT